MAWFTEDFALGAPLRDQSGTWDYYTGGNTSQYVSLVQALASAATNNPEITATGGVSSTPGLYSSDTTAGRTASALFAISGTAGSRNLSPLADAGAVVLDFYVQFAGANASALHAYLYSSPSVWNADLDIYFRNSGTFGVVVSHLRPNGVNFGVDVWTSTYSIGALNAWRGDGLWHHVRLIAYAGTVTTWTPGTFNDENDYTGGTLAVASDGWVSLSLDGVEVILDENLPLIMNFDGQDADESSPGSWVTAARGVEANVNRLSLVEFAIVGGSATVDDISLDAYTASSASPSASPSVSESGSASPSSSASSSPSLSASASPSQPPTGWHWPDAFAEPLYLELWPATKMTAAPGVGNNTDTATEFGTNTLLLTFPEARYSPPIYNGTLGYVTQRSQVPIAELSNAVAFSGVPITFRVTFHAATISAGTYYEDVAADGWIAVSVDGVEVYRFENVRCVMPLSTWDEDTNFFNQVFSITSGMGRNRLSWLYLHSDHKIDHHIIHANDPALGDLFVDYFAGAIDYPGKPEHWTYTDGGRPADYPKLIDIWNADVRASGLWTSDPRAVADNPDEPGSGIPAMSKWTIRATDPPAQPTDELTEWYAETRITFDAARIGWEPYYRSGTLITPPPAGIIDVKVPFLETIWSYPEEVSASASPSAEQITRPIRRMRQTPTMSEEQLWIFYHQFQLDLEVGLGLTEGQGLEPMLMLQWSNDSGHTWSDEYWVSAGRMGAYRWRAMWRRLGRGRNRVWRVTVSDPIAWRFLDAYLQAEKGVS